LKKNVVNKKHEKKGQYCKNYMLLIVRSNDHCWNEQNLHNIVKQKKHIPNKQQPKKKKGSEESFIEDENNEKIEC